MVRKLQEGSKCESGDCNQAASDMVHSRKLNKVIFCCDECADTVLDEGDPEYWGTCENCGCRQGVN